VKLTVVCNMSMDGVMQSPGRADEDTRGGFVHGGWGVGYDDEVMAAEMGKRIAGRGSLLLGRRTYEDFYKVWPNRKDNPYTEVLNKTQKYVASRTLKEPLPWQNSTLLAGDAVEAVSELKKKSDVDIGVLGSGELIRSLMPHGLIDEYLLVIHPLILGSGRRLFPDGVFAKLELVQSVPTTKGVLIVTYRSPTGQSGSAAVPTSPG
jgi:dihydrofolate reductase